MKIRNAKSTQSKVITGLPILVIAGFAIGACSAAGGSEESLSRGAAAATGEIGGITLQTILTKNFVGADNNGGGAVIATATAAQAWETFTIVDKNGGSLTSGDLVNIRVGGGQYVQAANGGGTTLNAASANQLDWETFRVTKLDGAGAIKSGDTIGLQTVTSGMWVSAQNGGGSSVFAYGAALGPWEEFVIGIGAGVPTQPVSDWKLAWSDEFNGTSLDESKWAYEVQHPGWVNNELENYTDHRAENARVENGHLVIEGRHDYYNGYEYSSARLKTQGKASFTYGRVEASIQLPGGWGTWPAFWMMPDDFSRGWPACGEIDIMEEVGFDQDSIHATTHSLTYNWKAAQQRTAATTQSGVTTGYHTYALEWFPDHLDMFVDGRKYFTSPNDNTGDDAWPFHKNFYIILNLAIGGDWGGQQGVDPNTWPKQMLVDYVRVYQK